VKVVDIDADTAPAHEGDHRHIRAHVEIDGLEASSVTVQALHGPINSEGEFIGPPLIVTLANTAAGVWEADYSVGEAGPYGVTVRAMPSHPDLISPVELGIIAWAS
jgi:starch phosphorylase